MAYCNKRLILASGSPRRRELLDKFGINYEILPAQGEESAPPELTPGERVKTLAAQKAEEVAQLKWATTEEIRALHARGSFMYMEEELNKVLAHVEQNYLKKQQAGEKAVL